ncbi:hypothetical protein Sango_1166500 [Sesamum angolense]|uniref:Uncharacterized protein n=1 Tax=Sesamum angolense TaxID=2727404 RepID=A0AAE1WWN7_9LAMI|nr:hypothetical protein Sango_1166500 [Sesamum angolense]
MAKSVRILLAIAAWYDYEIWHMDVKQPFSIVTLRKRSLWISQRVSLLLEKNRKFVTFKGPSMASNKFQKVGTRILMKSYRDMISSRTSMIFLYIRRRYHLLREMVSKDDIRMERASSTENTADPLTKPMSQIAHAQHLDEMGLRSMGDWL